MAHLAVHVQNPVGDPVPNVTVQVVGMGWAGVTDSNGNFDFGDVPPSTYTVKGDLDPASDSQTQTAPAGTTTPYLLNLPWTVTGKWNDVQGYCGDQAWLEVTAAPIPPDGGVTVEILHPSTGATVDTLTGNMSGGRLPLVWTAKAQTANWRMDRIGFRASVDSVGTSGNSSNQFTFLHRPTTNWARRDTDRGTPAGFADVYEIVDARLESDCVHYSIKIKLTQPFSLTSLFTDPWNAARQASEKSKIDTIWNGGFTGKKFHRKSCGRGQACDCAFDCCKAGFRFDCNFVKSGEHYAVEIRVTSTPGRSGTSRTGSFWYDPAGNPSTDYAHEVGHMLGQFDEYTGGASDPAGTQPAVAAAPNLSLMSTGGVSTLLNVHFRWVLQFLNASTGGDVYEIIPP